MEQLPEELLLAVLSLLDRSSLARAAAVCRRWHRLTADPVLASRLHLHLTPAQLLQLPCRAQPGSCVYQMCIHVRVEPTNLTDILVFLWLAGLYRQAAVEGE